MLASDFPAENPRTQTRTILIRKRYVQPKKTNDSATLKWKECKTPTLHKIKRGVFANTQAHTKTPHLILPNRTQAHPPPQKMNGLTTIK